MKNMAKIHYFYKRVFKNGFHFLLVGLRTFSLKVLIQTEGEMKIKY